MPNPSGQGLELQKLFAMECKVWPVAILKMTTGKNFKIENINKSQKEMLETLKKEAKSNGFRIFLNSEFVV